MNIKAILASLVLGSSSVAMAAPGVTVSVSAHADYGTTIVRDHRIEDNHTTGTQSPPIMRPGTPAGTQSPPIMRPGTPVGTQSPPIMRPGTPVGTQSPPIMRPGTWQLPPVYPSVTLASGLSFANQARTFITVGAQAGRFDKLQINAAGGRTLIKQVYVQFENGQEQIVRNLNRTLTGSESLTLDLDGDHRAIRRIVVYGSDLNTGIRRNPGAFTVTAS